jgi:hypothetical protein
MALLLVLACEVRPSRRPGFAGIADGARIGYIAQIFSALGFSIKEARHRAFLLYTYVLGGSVVPNLSRMQGTDRTAFVEELLVQTLRPPKSSGARSDPPRGGS